MEALIIYIDDNEETIRGYFEITERTSGYITFLTANNKITIPWNRVVKIKERGVDE